MPAGRPISLPACRTRLALPRVSLPDAPARPRRGRCVCGQHLGGLALMPGRWRGAPPPGAARRRARLAALALVARRMRGRLARRIAGLAAPLGGGSRGLDRLDFERRRGGCARQAGAPPAIGASAADVKPSQRHRSPSRMTRRWPGCKLRAAAPGPVGAATTPVCARRRARAGRRIDEVGAAARRRRAGRGRRQRRPSRANGPAPPRRPEASMSSPSAAPQRRFVARRDVERVDDGRPQVAASSAT